MTLQTAICAAFFSFKLQKSVLNVIKYGQDFTYKKIYCCVLDGLILKQSHWNNILCEGELSL